jgi:hypothetical protein
MKAANELRSWVQIIPPGPFLTTRELCYKVFVSRDTFCVKQLEYAEKQGFIIRKTVPLGGRRHPYTINKITSGGRKLLAEIRAVKKKEV